MNKVKDKKINFEILLKFFILTGFVAFFYLIIHSGKAELYVHPRIIIYMKFGIIAMVIIAIVTLGDIFKAPKRNVNLLPYMVFIIPLMLAFTQPAKILDSTSNQLSTNNSNNSVALNSKNSSNASDLIVSGDTIIVSDDNFYNWYSSLNHDIEKYVGKNIELRGFVYKDNVAEKNEFIAARLMMTCCAADIQPIGFLCKFDKAQDLKKGRYVKVTGKVEMIKQKKYTEAIINVSDMEMTDAPDQAYIYP